MEHLRLRARPGVVAWHTPNGGRRSAAEAARFKAMGVVAGIPDLLILADGRLYGLELKTSIGRPSPDQISALNALKAAGAIVAICHGLDQALSTLAQWGIFRKPPHGTRH